MAKIGFLWVVLCAGFVGWCGEFDRGIVGDGGEDEQGAAVVAGADETGLRTAGAVVRAAQKEVGIREHDANTGARVDEYNAYVGFQKVAWCASFVSWCYGQAGYQAPRTAWSPALFPSGRLATEAAPGMILGIYDAHLKRIGHCGIVEGVKNDLVYSIEGNTNVSGSREGDGVYRRIRHKRTIAKYADYVRGVK